MGRALIKAAGTERCLPDTSCGLLFTQMHTDPTDGAERTSNSAHREPHLFGHNTAEIDAAAHLVLPMTAVCLLLTAHPCLSAPSTRAAGGAAGDTHLQCCWRWKYTSGFLVLSSLFYTRASWRLFSLDREVRWNNFLFSIVKRTLIKVIIEADLIRK